MDVLKALDHVDQISKAANLPFEKVATVIRLQKQAEAEEQAERRSTPDERTKIEAGVAKLFEGNSHLEMTSREIAANLGLRTNQGNLSHISRTVRHLALTYQKAAE